MVKTTVLFIHSAGPQGQNQGSSPLIAYLEKELRDKYRFIHPQMPAPENPTYRDWKEELDNVLDSITEI